tara:strand:- start:1880 stop:2305 length:426 start_codon:yes stop_codon:yes gene_type:complete
MGVRLNHKIGDDLEEAHEINVTPFIDVMLVLLIIFMVAAPLATVDIPVDLPAAASRQTPRPDKPIMLTLKGDLSLALGTEPVSSLSMSRVLEGMTGGDKEQRIFLRADKSVPYGDLMDVMNDLRNAGYLKVALVTLDTPTP